MPIFEPKLTTAKCVTKHHKPILTKDDIPYEASLVFNAGVAKIKGQYVMVFRNDYGTTEELYDTKDHFFKGTSIGVAVSDNGIDNWKVFDKPLCDYPFSKDGEIRRLYDPRITVIDGVIYLCLAMDTKHGVRGAIAKLSDDFKSIEIISASLPDNRNMVLFPEKIDGFFYRLERPFPSYTRSYFDMWCSKSPDLKFWGESELVLDVENVPFANEKIGPAAPPVKTDKGWLTVFHSVDTDVENRGKNGWEPKWPKRYCAGIMLLDLKDPTKIVGISKVPLIAPELPFESEEGFRQNAIFPGGMILEDNGEVKIYYGSADTVECVATANVDDLVNLCLE